MVGSRNLRWAGAAPAERAKLIPAIAFGILLGYAGFLIIAFHRHLWILDGAGHPTVSDFAVFWTVGKMVLKGAAIAAYNVPVEHAAELVTIGHGFKQLLGWYYPPSFLFVVALLASLPFVPSFILWCSATLALHASVVAAIAEQRVAFAIACIAPWVAIVFIVGQNSLLISAIIGLVLLNLEKQPVLSGLILGLLSCKPQFGVLFPLALAAGGYWRTFLWAAISVVVVNFSAGVIFGFGIFEGFVHTLLTATDNHLVHSDLGWNKLESIYGLLRYLGAPAGAAWTMQALTFIVIALGVVLCWHNRIIPFSLKAALLVAAIPLATPYLLVYDLPMLGIAMAFLYRHREFDRAELGVFAVVAPTLFMPFFINVPNAPLAIIPIVALVLRRLYFLISRHGREPFPNNLAAYAG